MYDHHGSFSWCKVTFGKVFVSQLIDIGIYLEVLGVLVTLPGLTAGLVHILPRGFMTSSGNRHLVQLCEPL